MKKFLSIIMTLMLSSSLLVGCSAKDDGVQKIGLILSTLDNPFFVDLKTGIEKKANELGMKTMRQDAAVKVIEGLTTVEEMLRVTFIND